MMARSLWSLVLAANMTADRRTACKICAQGKRNNTADKTDFRSFSKRGCFLTTTCGSLATPGTSNVFILFEDFCDNTHALVLSNE